jgi:tetratricopeptide (TPR) repeat protein
LCEFVEGHPLALQLAAGWTRHFRVSEILRELEAGTLDLAPGQALAPGPAGNPGTRHRSIEAAIDHSWQRLVEAERRLLLRLSVFRGGFTLDAARAVAEASLPALATLIDKSLVRREDGGGSTQPARFGLHPLLLQFAAARHGADDRRAALQAHLHHYLGLLARFPRGRWAEQPAYYALLDPELENLRQAWQEAVASRLAPVLAQATIGLASYFHARGRCDDGAQLLELAEPVLKPDVHALAQLQCSAALLESTRSNYARTAELARQSLRISRRRGDARLLRAGLFLLGNALLNQGHYDASFRCYQESLERARAQGDAHGVAMNLNALAEVAMQAGRPEEAVRLDRQALDTVAALGLQNIDTLTNLGHAQRLAGQMAEALASFAQAGAALDPQTRGTEHTYLAYHHALARLALGETERAEALVQEAIAGLALGGQPMLAIGIGLLRARLALGRGRPAEAQALLREAAADATARRLPPWQLAALLQQAEVWQASAEPGALRRAGSLLRLVLQHPATPFEERQRAAAALARRPTDAAADAADAADVPTLDAAVAVLLAG